MARPGGGVPDRQEDGVTHVDTAQGSVQDWQARISLTAPACGFSVFPVCTQPLEPEPAADPGRCTAVFMLAPVSTDMSLPPICQCMQTPESHSMPSNRSSVIARFTALLLTHVQCSVRPVLGRMPATRCQIAFLMHGHAQISPLLNVPRAQTNF